MSSMHSCANFHKGKIVVFNARQQFHCFCMGYSLGLGSGEHKTIMRKAFSQSPH
jgi:hypothetical protein